MSRTSSRARARRLPDAVGHDIEEPACELTGSRESGTAVGELHSHELVAGRGAK